MKNWEIIMEYANQIDTACELYLHGITTKEQEMKALHIAREWVHQEHLDNQIDFTGYALIVGFIDETERGEHAINYITVLSAIQESFNTVEEYNEFEQYWKRLNFKKDAIINNWRIEEEEKEWADKFFSAL